jgi:fatty acid desaturase
VDRREMKKLSERSTWSGRLRVGRFVLLLAAAAAVAFRRWEILASVTLAWQIGSPIESHWHSTEHIGRPYDVNDHRLNTRSIRVGRSIKTIYWGLDDRVDHHLFPIVPSRNLPKLHRLLEKVLPRPNNVVGCWAEMFAAAREKDRDPNREFVSIGGGPATPGGAEERSEVEL